MGIPTLISTTTASGASALNITSGIDGTYDEYMLVLVDLYMTADAGSMGFNGSIDGGSNYDVAKTTTSFYASHNENDAETQFGYSAGKDVADGAGVHKLYDGMGDDADDSASGIIHLFSPANTTYVKHFYGRVQVSNYTPRANEHFSAGYFDTTSAINALTFVPSSETMTGSVQLYGIK